MLTSATKRLNEIQLETTFN